MRLPRLAIQNHCRLPRYSGRSTHCHLSRSSNSQTKLSWLRIGRGPGQQRPVLIAIACGVACLLCGVTCDSGELQSADETPMALSGFSASEAYEIEDHVPLDLSNPFLVRLLHRVDKISLENVAKYASYSKETGLQEIFEQPRKYRLWMFEIAGRVKKVAVHRYPDAAPDDALRGCYVVDVKTADGIPVQVICRSLPRAWRIGDHLDFATRFHGFFFNLLAAPADSEDPARGQPVFVASRLGWFPTRVDATKDVGESQVLLASRGVDIGRLDFVRNRNTQSLGRADGESFYQMLRAVQGIGTLPDQTVGFLDLMKEPGRQFARAVRLTARSRRCVKIEIADPDIRQRFGLNHYYELDLFIPIEGRVVVKTPEGENLVYQNRYPVTICVNSLPGGLGPEEMGDKQLEIRGFFYRFWKYRSEFTDRSATGGQVSPLIIALPPIGVETSSQLLDVILVGLLMGTIVLVLGLVVWFRQTDKRSSAVVRTAHDALPDRIDLQGVRDNLED